MKKEEPNLPIDVYRNLASLDDMEDDEIDTSDIPEITDWSGARRGVFYRPVKRQLTLRMDADIIAWFKLKSPGGKGYQTLINNALRDHVSSQERTPRSNPQAD